MTPPHNDPSTKTFLELHSLKLSKCGWCIKWGWNDLKCVKWPAKCLFLIAVYVLQRLPLKHWRGLDFQIKPGQIKIWITLRRDFDMESHTCKAVCCCVLVFSHSSLNRIRLKKTGPPRHPRPLERFVFPLSQQLCAFKGERATRVFSFLPSNAQMQVQHTPPTVVSERRRVHDHTLQEVDWTSSQVCFSLGSASFSALKWSLCAWTWSNFVQEICFPLPVPSRMM